MASSDVKLPEPIGYLYHDSISAESAHPWLHSTMLVLPDTATGCNETPLYDAPTVHRLIEEAKAEERERCARVCEQSDDEGEGPDSWGWHSKDYAKAIRKEGGA